MEGESTSTAVLVGNLSAQVTERELLDFFAFCGPIEGYQLLSAAASHSGSGDAPSAGADADADADTSEAVIQFGSAKAADTALLLTNAVLHGRPIAVTYFRGSPSTLGAPAEPVSPGGSGASPVDPALRSHTSAVASLVAAGYVLASDALDHARRMDEGLHVTTSLLGAAAMIQQQSSQGYRMLAELIEQFNAKYGVTDSARSVRTQIQSSVAGVDESLHLSTAAKDAYVRVDTGARDAYARADAGAREHIDALQQNDFVKNALSYWDSLAASVADLSRRAQEQAEPVVAQGLSILDAELGEIKRAVDDAKTARSAAAAAAAEQIAAAATAAAAAAAPASDSSETAAPAAEDDSSITTE